jgi:hypothetical protein
MSQRRAFGDVVQLDDEEEGPYHARILAPDQGKGYEECLQICLGACADAECREWWTLVVLDDDMNATCDHVYHVSECAMRDIPASFVKS